MLSRQNAVKWLKEGAGFLLLLFLLSRLINYWHSPSEVPETLPDLQGRTLSGEPVEEILSRPGPIIIHFWGTWCPVCRTEASNIAAAARRYPVLTVAVNSGSSEDLRRWMDQRGLTYPVLNDPSGTLARRFGIDVYPTTFIYDDSRRLKFVESGYITTAGLLARMKMAE